MYIRFSENAGGPNGILCRGQIIIIKGSVWENPEGSGLGGRRRTGRQAPSCIRTAAILEGWGMLSVISKMKQC